MYNSVFHRPDQTWQSNGAARDRLLKTITFILKRISHCIGRFVARQLIAEILQLLQLFPDIFYGVIQIVVIAAVGATRARGGFFGEALFLLHHHTSVRLTGGGGVVGLEFCRALRGSGGGGGSCVSLKPRDRSLIPRIVRIVLLFDLFARAPVFLRFRACYRARTRVPQRSTASTI